LTRLWRRGEFAWNGRHLNTPLLDHSYFWSSTALLTAAAIAAFLRRRRPENDAWQASGYRLCWAYVALSLLTLAALSIAFEYGASTYPSRRSPYFASGRLILEMLVPFLILYLDGAGLLLRPVSRRFGVLL